MATTVTRKVTAAGVAGVEATAGVEVTGVAATGVAGVEATVGVAGATRVAGVAGVAVK